VVNGVTAVFPKADYKNWGACDRLISQALAAIQLVADYGIKSETNALLFSRTGYYFDEKGLYNEAEPLYQQALDLRRELLGERHPDVATSLNNLALLYDNQGRYDEAEPLYIQALNLRRELLGERHPDVAGSLFSLGALRYNQGRYPEALDLLVEGEVIFLHTLGADHPDTQALQSWLVATRAALEGGRLALFRRHAINASLRAVQAILFGRRSLS
jgi:tetratricopeptide (TPR) repeat protein